MVSRIYYIFMWVIIILGCIIGATISCYGQDTTAPASAPVVTTPAPPVPATTPQWQGPITGQPYYCQNGVCYQMTPQAQQAAALNAQAPSYQTPQYQQQQPGQYYRQDHGYASAGGLPLMGGAAAAVPRGQRVFVYKGLFRSWVNYY